MPDGPPGDPPSRSRIQARRRGQLIEAAIDAIAEEGLSQVTLAKLAGRAGLSAAMVNFHFANKASLLLATLEALSAEFGRTIEAALAAAGPAPRSKLAAWIDTELSEALCDARKVAVWSAFWGESQARDEYQAVCGAGDRDHSRLCRQLFEAALGPARETEAAPLAEAFLGLLDGQAQNLLADPAAFDHPAARALCHRYLAAVLPQEKPETGPAEAAPRAWTLPAWSYNSPALFRREVAVLHDRHWQPVCHLSQLPYPGDWLTLGLGAREALLLRGRDGRVRAFVNLCRRRPHRLVTDPSGHSEALLTCPHDGWRYDDQGRLKGVPEPEDLPALEGDDLGLQPLDLEVYQGFVFLRAAGDGPTVAERLAPAAAALEAAGLESLTPLDGGASELAADWKLLMERFLEAPRLAASACLRDQGLAYSSQGLAFFPGATLEVDPETATLSRLQPLAAGRARLTWTRFARPQGSDGPKGVRPGAIDLRLSETLQQDLAAAGPLRGPLGRGDQALAAFHAWIARQLPEADGDTLPYGPTTSAG